MAATDTKKNTIGASAFVLMVGDEGAILVQMQKKKVVRRLFAQSPDPSHTRALDEALIASPKASITLLVDIMDQSYVRQTLPPVSSFSTGKIIKRRLDKDFSPEDITGYRILDREKAGRKDWNYLMVSLANPPLLQKWIAFVVERPNPFKGMGLIPLEAQPFLIAAEKILLLKEKGKDAKPAEWQILINHHKVGGFRQIILHNGKLIFTRMAQPIGESMPEIIAGNIEQEMTNTVEYLKRLGLQGPETISVIIVASEDIKKVLDPKNIKAGTYHFLTPHEMAGLLSMPDSAQPEDQFGDVIVAAFIGKRGKLILPLNTPYTRKLRNFSQAIIGTRLAAGLAGLAVLSWAGTNAADIIGIKQETEVLVAKQAGLHSQLSETKLNANILPKDINLLADVETMAKSFYKRRFDPLEFTSILANALGNDALSTEYKWGISEPLSTTADTDKRQLQAEIKLRLTVPTESLKLFIASATALIDRIKTSFPEFEVTHSELPGVLPEGQDLKAVIDDSTNSPSTQKVAKTDTDITITIAGPLQKTGPKHK